MFMFLCVVLSISVGTGQTGHHEDSGCIMAYQPFTKIAVTKLSWRERQWAQPLQSCDYPSSI